MKTYSEDGFQGGWSERDQDKYKKDEVRKGLFGYKPKQRDVNDEQIAEYNKYFALTEVGDFFHMSSSPVFKEDGPLSHLNIESWG